MKILSINIFNFGKLSNFTLNFDKELHILDKPNGYGKTTIAEFINAMFFGMPSMQVKTLANKRRKYAPWNQNLFGGSLTFIYKEKTYEVTRTFGPDTISTDTFKLTDYKTKIEVDKIDNEKIDGKNFGEVLFKINQVSFERTNFIPQEAINFDLGDEKLHNDISIRLREIFGDTSDDNNYKKAEKKIDEKINILSPNSRRSDAIYVTNEEKIVDVNNKLNNSIKAKEDLILQNNQLITLNENLEENNKNLKIIKDKLKIINAYNTLKLKEENYLKSKNKLTELNNDLNKTKEFFINIDPKDVNLNNIKEKTESLNNNFKELEDFKTIKNEEINKIRDEKSTSSLNDITIITIKRDIKNLESELKIKETNKKETEEKIKKISFVDILLSVLTIGIYLIIFLIKNNKLKTEIKEYDKNINTLKNKIEDLNKELEELTSNDNIDYDKKINELLKDIKTKEEEYELLLTNTKKLFSNFNVDLNNLNVSLYKITDTYNNYFKLLEEIKALEEEIKEYNLEEFKELKDYKHLDEESLNKEEKILTNNNNELIKEITELTNNIKDNEDLAKDHDFLLTELDDLKEKRLVYEKKRELLLKTKELLLSANQTLAIKYLKPLEKEVNKLIETFNLDDLKIAFDGDAKVKVKEKDSHTSYDFGYFSSGNKEFMSVLIRLALIDIIYKDITPFIVLDDTFSNFDDLKIKQVRPFLDKLKQKYQIIYFTCSSSRNLS